MNEEPAEDEPTTAVDPEPGGGRAAAIMYALYVVATVGLWWATVRVRHGWTHVVLEGLAIVFTALAVWAIGFVVVAFVRAAGTVAGRRREPDA